MGRPVDESLISQQVVLPSGVAALPSTRCSWEAVKGPEDFEAAEVHSSAGWDSLPGFDSQQLEVLQRAATKGVFWQHPTLQISRVFALHYGGDVDADGNCLFTAVKRAMQLSESPTQIRAQTVKKFLEDYHGSDAPRRDHVDSTIRNLYSPNLSSGWGVHVVQELKLLAKKADRTSLESEIDDFAQAGMTREAAMESVYNDRCIHVQDASSWAKYMSISGQSSDEYDIVTLLYTEEGLLSIETNPDGRAAAFGDDIAIEALASELGRQIFVVQVHGKDVTTDNSEGLLFFLPHTPQQAEIGYPPLFLLMRGTGWCGAGGDHYEPVLTKALPVSSKEKAGFILWVVAVLIFVLLLAYKGRTFPRSVRTIRTPPSYWTRNQITEPLSNEPVHLEGHGRTLENEHKRPEDKVVPDCDGRTTGNRIVPRGPEDDGKTIQSEHKSFQDGHSNQSEHGSSEEDTDSGRGMTELSRPEDSSCDSQPRNKLVPSSAKDDAGGRIKSKFRPFIFGCESCKFLRKRRGLPPREDMRG